MLGFQKGDNVPNEINLVRRLSPDWIENGVVTSREAYRPRKLRKTNVVENVSVEVEDMITIPYEEDDFSKRNPAWSAGRIISNVPNNLGYPVQFDGGRSGAHAALFGDMEFLHRPDGDPHLEEMIQATVIFYP